MTEDELDPQIVKTLQNLALAIPGAQPNDTAGVLVMLSQDEPYSLAIYQAMVALKAEVLAEAQARETALRDALADVVDPIEMYRRQVPAGYTFNAEWAVRAAEMAGTGREIARKALALPTDRTALDAALDAALAAARREERARCREAVWAERLIDPDSVYDRAIEDAVVAIDVLSEIIP